MSLKRFRLAGVLALLVVIGIFTGPTATAASSVSGVAFTSTSSTARATADWTVAFKTSNGSGGALAGGSTILVTFNTSFTVPQNPVVTLSAGFSGCTPTATTSASTVTVTLAGPTCTLQKNTAGSLTIAAITNAPVGSYPANSFTVSTSSDTNATPAPGPIVMSAGAATKLAFIQGPASGFAGTALPPITVQVQDQLGNPASTAGTAVTLTASAGVINAGASIATDSTGRATFNGVTINSTVLGLTLTATAQSLAPTGPSATFNITVAVSNGATLTNTSSDGSGSGVKSVGYFYCATYAGACTSANWTAIASSTNPATNYQVNWTSQPANGAYQVVAISTDNVSNASQPGNSTPVTITN
ncbi:hypothetical protein [Kribbella sp. NPDC048928]|uniref:hypothetical protein n=1 Tax=Kribbella sp. NPDC048928 TaxID=3364111 RepID=UPI0037208331